MTDVAGESSTSKSSAVERIRSLLCSRSACIPVSNTAVPSGCSTRNAPTGIRICPDLARAPSSPASVVSHPHVSVRTRTAIGAPYAPVACSRDGDPRGAGRDLLLVGIVWILQGLDVLGGSGMSGHIEWTVIGAILVVVAVALLAGARKVEDE